MKTNNPHPETPIGRRNRPVRPAFALFLAGLILSVLLPSPGAGLGAGLEAVRETQDLLAHAVGLTDPWGGLVYPCESTTAGYGPNLSGASDERGYGVEVSPDGKRLYVTGTTGAQSKDADLYTVAYDAEKGNKLWEHTFDVDDGSFDIAYSVVASPLGDRLFVAGFGLGTLGWTQATLSYRIDGDNATLERVRRQPAFLDMEVAPLAVSPDGLLVFVSYAETKTGPVVTRAYRAADLGDEWNRSYNGPMQGLEGPMELAVSPDGARLFVAGTTQGATGLSFLTLSYRANGTDPWVQVHDGDLGEGIYEVGIDLAVSPDSQHVYAAGWTSTGILNNRTDYLTIAYGADGAPEWQRLHNGGGYGDLGHAVAVNPDGRTVYVSGGSDDLRSLHQRLDYTTLAYKALEQGADHWGAPAIYNGLDHGGFVSHPGHGIDRALEMAATPDGSGLVLTGCSMGPGGNYDYATVAYEADGTERWSRRYNSTANPGDDTPWHRGLALSPDGSKAFVTGRSDGGVERGTDMATLAYEVGNGTLRWEAREDAPVPVAASAVTDARINRA